MIRAICLNPVVDRVYSIDDFAAGSIYRGNNPAVYAGGKGVNVARVAALMGEPCALYGFIGGSTGAFIQREIARYSIESHLIEVSVDTRTTINIIDRDHGRETEIIEAGKAIGPNGEERFFAQCARDISAGDIVICSGILIPGMGEDTYKRVSQLCGERGAKCFLDTNSSDLRNALPASYQLCKPNERELRELFPQIGPDDTAVDLAQRLMVLGVERVLLSRGEAGGMLLSENRVLKAGIPGIEVCSTIGSGDASIAGFAVGESRGLNPAECLKLAMACGMSNAASPDIGVVDRRMVAQYMEAISVAEQ